MPTDERLTGLDLKLARTAARLTGKEVARRMGISGSRLSKIEHPDNQVTEAMRRRYMAALGTSGTSSHAAERD